MEKIVLDTAIKFGAGRYRQEQGLLEQCGEEVKRFGKKAYIVAGPRAFACALYIMYNSINLGGRQCIQDSRKEAQKETPHIIRMKERIGTPP